MSQEKKTNIFRRFLLGLLAGTCAYAALLFSVSLLVVHGIVPEDAAGWWIKAAAAAATAAVALLLRDIFPDRLLSCATCAVTFWCLLALIGFLSSGRLAGGQLLAMLPPVLLGAAAAALPLGRKGKRKPRRHAARHLRRST